MSVECTFNWSTLATGQKQWTVYFPSANSCQGQLQTPRSVSVHRHYLNVTDQIKSPRSLYPGRKNPFFSEWEGRGVGHNESGLLRERKNCLPLPGTEPQIIHYTYYVIPTLIKI